MLCPRCRKLISIDGSPCPYCGLRNPASPLRNNFLTRAVLGPDQFVRFIIFLNAGMFILSIAISPRSAGFSMNPFSFLSPGQNSILLLGATGTIPIVQFHRWWTLLSAIYLHGSILHIVFNMIAFSQICPFVIQEYGIYRTAAIYTLAGVGGYVVSLFAGIPFTLGASGAVCGLIGAALYYGKSRGGSYGDLVYRQVGGWAVGIFIFGFLFPGINNWAHGGGLACGVLAAFMLGYHEKAAENYRHSLIAWICIGATCVTLAWAILTTFVILASH